MKYLVISDIHGSIFHVNKLEEIIKYELPDKVIILGDIFSHINQVDKTNDEYKNIQTLSITLNNVDKGIQENHKQIQTLTENNEALQLRVDTLTRNNKVKDKQIKDLKEENLSLRQSLSFWKDKFLKVISFIKDKLFGKEKEREKYMDVAEDLYSKKIIEEDTFEDLQDTYEFSKNHDYERDKDDFDMQICAVQKREDYESIVKQIRNHEFEEEIKSAISILANISFQSVFAP